MHDTETVDALPPVASAPPLPPGTVVDGRYEVGRALGRGGAAVVYAAIDRVDRREIALKVLHRLSPSAIKRLEREATITQQLDDPLLVRRYGVHTTAEGTYLTMELVDGVTLREHRAAHAPSVEEVVAIAAQLFRALALLHAHGILHRDIKPSNVLRLRDDSIKLADFGLALDTSDPERLTATDAVIGTIDYLAPEQALGREIDARADLYAAGIVLFELLTGVLPFPPSSAVGTLVARIQRRAPDVRTLRRDTPAWLARMIARLLEARPADRFATAEEVLAALAEQRVPRRWRRGAAVSIATAATIVAVALAIPRHHFARVNETAGGLAGVDDRGKVLWQVAGLNPQYAAIVRQNGAAAYLAYITDHGTAADEATNHELKLLDVRTAAVRTITLPDMRQTFVSFSPTFHVARVLTAPLDKSGNDVIIVTYAHRLYWPSYSIMCDPITGATGPVFVASGHHHCIGSMDVNHDGRYALIFAGINNRLGWYTSVAAVRVTRQFGSGAALPEFSPASTPDYHYDNTSPDALLWYTLIAPTRYQHISIANDKVLFELADGRHVTVGGDGRPAGTPPIDAAAQRRAYQDLADALHLRDGGFERDALKAAASADGDATISRDAMLTECIRRVHASLLIANGDYAAAERELTALVGTTAAPADVSYDAARAFHRHGHLPEAVRWYRLARARAVRNTVGRAQYEIIEGEVLALQQLGNSKEALRACDDFNRAFPHQANIGEALKEYVHWRSGDPVAIFTATDGSPDEMRYWQLECRLASGERAESLLPLVLSEEKRTSDLLPAVHSLHAELLGRLRDPGASSLAKLAVNEARATNDPLITAHLPVIAERAGRLARM